MEALIDILSKKKDLPPMKIQMHQLPQPWHPQSTLVHEFALAVRKVYGEKVYFEVSNILFNSQKQFYDDESWGKTRDQMYTLFCTLCKDTEVKSEEILPLLKRLSTGHNSGNSITSEFTKVVKYHRKRGVHVTPTVYVNGIEATEISSGWTTDQWLDFLKEYNIK